MKCSNCGGTEFIGTEIIYSVVTEGEVSQAVKAYACKKCGHIELFMRQEELDKCIKNNLKYNQPMSQQQYFDEQANAKSGKKETKKNPFVATGERF